MTHQKITNIFQYLKDYNNKRNPIKRSIKDYDWYLKIEDLPKHPRVKIGSFRENESGLVGDDFILKVQRPNLTKPPTPPKVLDEWLKKGWEHADGTVAVSQSINVQNRNGETIIIQFNDDQSRVEAFKNWRPSWEEWARNELPALAAAKLFENLFALYGTIEREAEKIEMVLGEGIIACKSPNGIVHHPILLQKLQLEFDPETPVFTIRETDHPLELYSSLFLEIPDVDGNLIAQYRKNLDELPIHPLGQNTTTGFLKRLAQSMTHQAGAFVETGEPVGSADHIRIGRAPFIFMRNRALGFASAIDSIIADLQIRQDFSPALLNVAGIEAEPTKDVRETATIKDLSGSGNEDTDILLSKEANPEQLEIARRLDKHGCVLVQGPPGTGKTHTIANLIGHLLAQGKRILVTSHTTKALRVLREHVVEDLRPLCVSVLERDTDSRKQLENSITTIDEKFTSLNLHEIENKAVDLKKQRNEIVEDLKKIRHELSLARGDEYRDLVVEGSAYSPSQAARIVAGGTGKDDWIPGPLPPGEPLPITVAEVSQLYNLNGIISEEDEEELKGENIPDASDFLTPDAFDKLVSEKKILSSENLRLGETLWVDNDEITLTCPCGTNNRLKKQWLGFTFRCKGCKQELKVETGHGYAFKSLSIDSLNDLSGKVQSCVEPLLEKNIFEWSLMIVRDGMRGPEILQTWNTLLKHIEDTKKKAASASELLIKYDPKIILESSFDQTLIVLNQIKQHVACGKSFSRWCFLRHKEWKSLINRCSINSHSPKTVEHFQALAEYAELLGLRKSLIDRWIRMISSKGGPSVEQDTPAPEMICAQYVNSISLWLNWHQGKWIPLEQELCVAGLKMQDIFNQQPAVMSSNGDIVRLIKAINTIPAIIAMRTKRLRLTLIKRQLRDLSDAITAKLEKKSSCQRPLKPRQ